jgi:hypothetical protein
VAVLRLMGLSGGFLVAAGIVDASKRDKAMEARKTRTTLMRRYFMVA